MPQANPDPKKNISSAALSTEIRAPESLGPLYDSVVEKAKEALQWYERSQREKKTKAIRLRMSAIVLGAFTTIVPSLISLLPEHLQIGSVAISAVKLNPIATICGVAAATLILLDKFYGFSSAWMRYVTTFQLIQSKLERFQLDWAEAMYKLHGAPPRDEEAIAAMHLLGDFLGAVNDAVRDETNAWVGEFKGALTEIDHQVDSQRSAAIALPASAAKGRIKLVTDGTEKLDGSKWQIQLDDRREIDQQQSSGIWISGPLDPSIYKVRVSGLKSDALVAIEDTVSVKPGEVAELKLKIGA